MTRGRDRNDDRTGDLLSWEPPVVVKRYDEQRIKTATMRARVAHAVSETLSESEFNRDTIASKMSEFLGEEVSKNMLDAYASEAREEHTISYVRLLALIYVTNDVRPLQVSRWSAPTSQSRCRCRKTVVRLRCADERCWCRLRRAH